MVQKNGRIPTFTMKTCISEKRANQHSEKVVACLREGYCNKKIFYGFKTYCKEPLKEGVMK
jgi:hypothetical protein